MARPFGLRQKLLDGRMLFYHYYEEMGKGTSLNKMARWLYKQGIYNQDTGEEFSTSAIFQAIWRWALQNLEESEPVIKKWLLNNYGEVWSDEQWKHIITERVKRYLNKTQKRNFYDAHPEYKA